MLATHQQHEHLCLYALRAIPRHCQGTAAKQVVIGEGHGITLLAASMRRHEENVNIQDGCMSVMNKVMDTVQVLPQLGMLIENGCKEILLAMRKFKFAPNLQLNGCQLLAGIGKCEAGPTVPQRFRDAAVSVCASVLKVHAEKVDHVEEACNAIGALYNVTCAEAVDMKVVTTRVLLSMEVDPLRSIMQKSIANCLRVMCKDTVLCQQTYLENNGIALSLKMVDRHPALVGFHCDTWNLFETLMQDDATREMLIKLGGINEVLNSMEVHYAHKGVQLVTSRIACILAHELPEADGVWDWAKVVKLGLSAVELHRDIEPLCISMCKVFQFVIYSDEDKYGPVFMHEDEKAVERMLMAILEYEDDDLIQACYQTMWKLSDMYDSFHEPFFRLKGDQHVPVVINRFTSDLSKLEPATGVLRNLLGCPEFPKDTKYECLGVLLKELKKYAANQGYVEEVCGVLAHLSTTEATGGGNMDLGSDSLNDIEIVSVLIEVLIETKDPQGPQAAAFQALLNLLQTESGELEPGIVEVMKSMNALVVIFDTLTLCRRAQGTLIMGMDVVAKLCKHPDLVIMLPPVHVTIPVFENCYKNVRFVNQTQSSLCEVLIAIHSCRTLKDYWKELLAAKLNVATLRSQGMHPNSKEYQTLAMDVLSRCAEKAPKAFVPMVCTMAKKFMQHLPIQVLAFKGIAVWARLSVDYQVALHECNMLGFAADRMDSFMDNNPYTIAVITTCQRLAVTENYIKELAEHGAMLTMIKLIEQKKDHGGVMVAVFNLLGAMLNVPSCTVGGMHFRLQEASNNAMETHAKNAKLQTAMAGCIFNLLERYQFKAWILAHTTTASCLKVLEGLKVEPDISIEQKLSLQQSIFLGLSTLSRREGDADQKILLADDAKPMHLIVDALKTSIEHAERFPERIFYDDLQQHAWLIMARAGESTDFSANAAFNKVASKMGPPQMTRHKLVSDLQLAIATCLYNSEAIRFEKEPPAPAVEAAGVRRKSIGKKLGGFGGLKKKPGLGGGSLGAKMKASRWGVIRKAASKIRDTRTLRSHEDNKLIKDCSLSILLNHKNSADLLVCVWGVWHRLYKPEEYRYQVFKEGSAKIAMEAMFESNRWFYTHHQKSWIREEALLGLRFIFIERDLKHMDMDQKKKLIMAVLDSLGAEYVNDHSLIEVAHGTLMALTEFENLKPLMIEVGALKILAHSFVHESSEIHWHVVSSVLNLCSCSAHLDQMDPAEVLRVIVKYSSALSTCNVSLSEAMAGQRLTPAVDRIHMLTKYTLLCARLMLDETNRTILCEAGCVDHFLFLMLQNRTHLPLIEECVAAMRQAASHMADVFNDHNHEEAVKALTNAIEDYPQSTRTHVSALACLRYILPVNEYRLYSLKHAEVRTILKSVLVEEGESEIDKAEFFDIQIETLAIFQELCMSSDARGSLIQHGLRKILDKMLLFKDDHRLQLEGCIMLERISLYPEALGADWADDALKVLIQAIRTHVHHPLLREEAITGVLYLTRTDDNRINMKRDYGDRTLALLFTQCTKDHPERSRLCINAWGLVAEMNREFFDTLVTEQFPNGVPTAVEMLIDPPLDLIGPLESGMGELQAAACDVLSALLPMNDFIEFGEMDIVGAVVSAMKGLLQHEELQFKGTIILGQATNSEIALNMLVRTSAIGTIVGAMTAWSQSEDVVGEGFKALSKIAGWGSAKRAVLHEGVFDHFREWLGAHLEDGEICGSACSLLANVADDEIICAELVAKGLGTFVLQMLGRYQDSQAIIYAVSTIACSPTLRPILLAANAEDQVNKWSRSQVGTELEPDYNDLMAKLDPRVDPSSSAASSYV